jgi:HD-like signal output (HDOD) protein
VHHGELGGLIAQRWELPEILVRGITYHHNPQEAQFEGDNTICFAVYLADIVAEMIGAGLADISPDLECAGAMDRLAISGKDLSCLCKTVEERLDQVLALYA